MSDRSDILQDGSEYEMDVDDNNDTENDHIHHHHDMDTIENYQQMNNDANVHCGLDGHRESSPTYNPQPELDGGRQELDDQSDLNNTASGKATQGKRREFHPVMTGKVHETTQGRLTSKS